MKLPSDCIPGIFCHGCPIIFILSRVLHTIRACISGSPARYIERQTECGEYVYAHKAAKAALAFDPFNSSLNMHLTILLYQQSGAGTANAFYTGIKRHLTEAHIQRIKQTCPNMII